jgi:serine/threonine protein kinase/DNA-binding response OmpR family regulator
MPPQLSGAEFLRNLQDSGLYSKEIEAGLKSSGQIESLDGEAVAQALIAAGKLTPFQAYAVAERKFEELAIGNYQVLDRLGAGGMGTVYKALHRRMKRIVAIKVLSRSVAESPTFVQRFQREVEAVARLSHPNVVMAYDADEAEIGHFLVMEFVDGRDLASEVQDNGPLSVTDAVDCIAQAARALDYAHTQGIIHRDIKPANLMRDVHGVVKVADLGLARFSTTVGETTAAASGLTQAGTIMGTVDFMSPEQAAGAANIDGRADIYSLGCTLYYLVTGQPIFAAPTLMAKLLAHRDTAAPSLRAACPGAPDRLEALFQRMVTKKAADRVATMAEVVSQLESLTFGPESEAQPEFKLGPAEPTSPSEMQTVAATAYINLTPSKREMDLAHAQGTQKTVVDAPDVVPIGRGQTLVLVEPSRTQVVIVRKLLEELEFAAIHPARTGAEALETADRVHPSIMISAMHLPDMTGLQLVQKIRADGAQSSIGFVLITSQGDTDRLDLSQVGAHTIRLPKPFDREQLAHALAVAMGAPARGAEHPASDAIARLRVLIVDDSAAARVHIRNVLASLGLSQFVEAADGARAVAAVVGNTFDLIITDYNMPYMDGLGFLAYLKQNPSTASIPVVMVTTETDASKLAAVRTLGAAAVCEKSFPADVVRNIIDDLVTKP